MECAFGIITSKWALLKKAIETEVEKAEKIIKCICLLHNIIIDREGKSIETYHSREQIYKNVWQKLKGVNIT